MSKLKTFFNKPFPHIVLLPILLFAAYFALALICYLIWPDAMLSNVLLDGITCIVLGVWCLKYTKTHDVETKKLQFSIFGWGAFFGIFFCIYWFSEAVGNYIARAMPDALSTEAYQNLANSEALIYALLGVTIAPIAEELLFRFGIFRLVREKASFWVAYLISTALFTVAHMTLMHIPVAIMFSLFVCTIYEYTKRIRYCIVLHILFNFFAVFYLFSASIPMWLMCTLYGVTLVGLVALYYFRDKVFGKIFKTGGMQQFESYLDEKRKHFGEKPQEEHDASEDQDA